MFALMYHHNKQLSEWENMVPWERDVYLKLLGQAVEAENERYRQAQQERGH